MVQNRSCGFIYLKEHHPIRLGGHFEMTRFLASKSVWLDSYDSSDDTPLHLAARGGGGAPSAGGGASAKICRLLLDSGAKKDLVNKRGLTPLGEALLAGNAEAAGVLLEKGADASVRARG